jgi:hypothetical protein
MRTERTEAERMLMVVEEWFERKWARKAKE